VSVAKLSSWDPSSSTSPRSCCSVRRWLRSYRQKGSRALSSSGPRGVRPAFLI